MESVPQQRINSFTIVWLNELVTNQVNFDIIIPLQQHFSWQVHIFDNAIHCIDFLSSFEDDKFIVLLTSKKFGEDLVPVIYNFHQLMAMYIVCFDCDIIATDWIHDYPIVSTMLCHFISECGFAVYMFLSELLRQSSNR